MAEAISAREAALNSAGLDFDSAAALAGTELLQASGWTVEPLPRDEILNTPWADPGWHSWNNMSPEVELCELVVSLIVAARPKWIIETGTGQGFLTRRIGAVLRGEQSLTCFESDPMWRKALTLLPFFDGEHRVISPNDSPNTAELATADLTFLDADFPYRLPEITRWWQAAAEGAVVVVHDAGNRHGPDTAHATVRALIVELAIPGFFLANPRGAFIGVKSSRGLEDLQQRVKEAEAEVHALRATKTFRYSAPARRLYAGLRSGGISRCSGQSRRECSKEVLPRGLHTVGLELTR